MVIFIELVQYAKNLGGKSRKNLVGHQIIKLIRKFNSIICRFFAPHSRERLNALLFFLAQPAVEYQTVFGRRELVSRPVLDNL